MKLNKLIFPAPPSSYSSDSLKSKILYIPRKVLSPEDEETKTGFFTSSLMPPALPPIPCLYLREKTVGSSKLLLYFHGNAEDVGLSHRDLDILKKSLKINVLAMEYPGYGIYQDKDGCSAEKIKRDCDYLYRYLIHEIGLQENDIIIFGRSIGSGPATFLASKHKPGALALMSAYTSVRDIAKQKFGWLGYLMHSHFDNLKQIQSVQCPTFLVHGRADDLIVYQHSEQLHERCTATHKIILLHEHMTHNDFDYHDDIVKPLQEFIDYIQFSTAPNELRRTIVFDDSLFVPPQ